MIKEVFLHLLKNSQHSLKEFLLHSFQEKSQRRKLYMMTRDRQLSLNLL
jgi:hypothetical protein